MCVANPSRCTGHKQETFTNWKPLKPFTSFYLFKGWLRFQIWGKNKVLEVALFAPSRNCGPCRLSVWWIECQEFFMWKSNCKPWCIFSEISIVQKFASWAMFANHIGHVISNHLVHKNTCFQISFESWKASTPLTCGKILSSQFVFSGFLRPWVPCQSVTG